MGSDDIDVLGALHSYLTESPERLRIEPPLPPEEYETFLLRYLGLCLHGYPDSEWAEDVYSAGRLWGNLFRERWRESGGPSPQVEALKTWLADYYRAAGFSLQGRIITSLLEHLFTDEEFAAYFSDWREDPVLREAYEHGMIWPRTFYEERRSAGDQGDHSPPAG
jgi:hypothetical protein